MRTFIRAMETRARKYSPGRKRWRGKVSFNDFDMGGRHVPPCNLHYSRDVSGACDATTARRDQRER